MNLNIYSGVKKDIWQYQPANKEPTESRYINTMLYQQIQDIHWQNHFRTATALTPSLLLIQMSVVGEL